MTTISWLMMFREIITVHCENHTKTINTLCGQSAQLLNIIACDTRHVVPLHVEGLNSKIIKSFNLVIWLTSRYGIT
jgi:hypothetical protein